MFTLEIDTGNAAFDDAPATVIARILRELAQDLEEGSWSDGRLYDYNGNFVGDWKVEE